MEFKKIVNPCKTEYGQVFVTIHYQDGRLSITGVEGPLPGGNCKGSAGQISHRLVGTPNEGWTQEMIDKLIDVWDTWHLNDMRPYCEHQKATGWNILACKRISLYHYKLRSEISSEQRRIMDAATANLKNGESVKLTEEELALVNLPYFKDVYAEPLLDTDEYYKLYKTGYGEYKEVRALAHIRPEEYEEGLLAKPCPVCGYKYGTGWRTETIPDDIVAWLCALPNANRTFSRI